MGIFNQIPEALINFIVVIFFSFAIGLEQYKLNPTETERKTFGADCTCFLTFNIAVIVVLYML